MKKIFINIIILLSFLTSTPLCAQEKEKEVVFCWDLYFFNFLDYTDNPECEAQIEELVAFMNEFPNLNFQVSGHTDSFEPEAYKMQVSQRRGDYIRNMLIQQGEIAPERLVSRGYGDFLNVVIPDSVRRVCSEDELNSRGEVRILKTDSLPHKNVWYEISNMDGGCEKAEKGHYYTKVEQRPQYPGGDTALCKFMEKCFTKDDLRNSYFVECVVKKNGKFKVLNDTFISKKLRRMPRWKPAKCQGKAVSVKFLIYISKNRSLDEIE
ncbi:MAG TPA: OmpA family protein [Paludibacteraceae bacterium]|nr:OmpA family protein [Paludibacteraceae bacterium]HOU68457.1 OmpA family protein [Paludibacteraceae bacterium]HQF50309.1 OmpA family protein [Paludibacteraceae bacterium]HQJ89486.1 OmpA family protein [Paludibacteraceae bacterium]